MRHLKVNSQKEGAGRRTIGTRNSREISTKNVQNDRNNIGKRINNGAMPRTRKRAMNANTSSPTTTSVTSSNQNKIPNNQNGNDQQRSYGEMATILRQRNEVMPCMTGLDRVANWKSSSEYSVVDYYKKDQGTSPRQTVKRSSIQERISYDKVSSSTSYGHQSPNSYDFKVPSTIHRNENSGELIDLTDDASESNASSITTTQEELYSYLGVVTKSQASKMETETENKTVKRSSLRVKVKQIALRNQEIYKQLKNNKKLEAEANNSQSLVRYNGHRIQQSSVQARRENIDARQTQYGNKYQQYTQSTYKSTTLVNNTTSTQQTKNNYNTTSRNRFSQIQNNTSSYQLVPYSFNHPSTVRNSTNKCTVMERFVYKSKQDIDPVPIQVNANKYKTSTPASNAPTSNRVSNGPHAGPLIGSKTISSTMKPDVVPPRPPQITAGIKRKAMEQWIELNSSHPTSSTSNNTQSNSNNSSYTSFHQNMITTTNISTHRKIQKVDVSTVRTHYVKNVSPSNTLQTSPQTKVGSGNVFPHRKIQNIDSNKGHLQSPRPVQNMGTINPLPLQRSIQQNSNSNKISSPSVHLIKSAEIHLKNIRSSNALQTCSQTNIGNNRISKRRISPKLNSEVKKAIIHQAQSLQNIVTSNAKEPPRKVQNVNSNNVPAAKAFSMQNNDKGNSSSVHSSPQKNVSSNVPAHKFSTFDPRVSSSMPVLENIAVSNVPPHKFSTFDPRVSSSMPVLRSIAVSNVSSLQTSSQQYISTNGNKFFEVNIKSKRESSVQLRAIQNIETGSTSASEKNSQHNIDTNNVSTCGNVDSNRAHSMKMTHPIQNIVASNVLSLEPNSQQKVNTNNVSLIKNVQNVDFNKATSMQLIHAHSMENILLLPTSTMETKKAFQPPLFNIQSTIATPSKDLNENVAKDNKPEIPINLSLPINNVPTDLKRDSKTNFIDDVKPCLTPIDDENIANTDFLQKMDGIVLSVLNFDDQFLVIQEKLISFWTLPSVLSSIFGIDQQYVCVGKIKRYNCDIEIETPYQHRLLVIGNKTTYVELRAQKVPGTYTRESLMSIYLTLYSFNDQRELTFRHIEFDRVHGSIPSVRYTVLPKSSSIVICWYEVVTKVRKCYLNANNSNMECDIFPGCREILKKIQFFGIDKIIAFGNSTITIWDNQSGDITCKIDTHSPIGDNLYFFSLHENTDQALFLVQSFTNPGENIQLIKLLSINMNKNYSSKVICTHEMPSNGAKITSMAAITNHFITTYENGHSFLLNLYNPRQFVVCLSKAKGSKYFVTNDKVITIDNNQLIAKTFVDHFFGQTL